MNEDTEFYPMKFAFVLFKYFPYGGLQRDCVKIAQECQRRGHQVDVYCLEWSGPQPEGIRVEVLSVHAWLNYRRYEKFAELVRLKVAQQHYDGLIGFNRMAGLDVYYAADPCYAAKVKDRSCLYRVLPRTRSFLKSEQTVFAKDGHCHILLISPAEKDVFTGVYQTPEARMTLLPPGIQRDRLRPPDYQLIRQQKRDELGLSENTLFLLMVGSGFKTKGVDRSLKAVAALPEDIKEKALLYVIGQDSAQPFKRMAKGLRLDRQVFFPGGRDDIPELLFAADLLLHPAYRENTGTVLLEAMAAGLPQLVSGVCGYSFYINQAQCGVVLDDPFQQNQMNAALVKMLTDQKTELRRKNAMQFVAEQDVFSMPERAVDKIEQVLEC